MSSSQVRNRDPVFSLIPPLFAAIIELSISMSSAKKKTKGLHGMQKKVPPLGIEPRISSLLYNELVLKLWYDGVYGLLTVMRLTIWP